MEAGNVLVRIRELQLLQDVMADAAGGAGRKRGNRTVREMRAQFAQLPVFRPELVAPFGDAVRFVNCEERNRHAAQPANRVFPRKTLRREIDQTILARPRLDHHARLLR